MIDHRTIDVGGVPTRIRSAGTGGVPIIFLHGGIPGVTPYCGSGALWEDTLAAIATPQQQVIAIDLLASGETGYKAEATALVIDDLGTHFEATLDALGLTRIHAVGHDLGGLVALWAAIRAPATFESISIVASAASAPIGDWVDDLVFQAPPLPLWAAASQRWALERVSFDPRHIDADTLATSVAAAHNPGPAMAAKTMADADARARFNGSMSRTKAKLWALARDAKLDVPLQVIAAANDPLTTPAHALTLFQTLGQSQPLAQYHLVDRSGSFVFREQPARFLRLLGAFHEGLAATPPQYRYA